MIEASVIGSVIGKVREEKKLSQEVASGLAGIGRTHWSAIERGARKPTVETFCRIADALGIRASVLMQKIEEENDRHTRSGK